MTARRLHRRRLLLDADALHALAVALLVLVLTGGLAYVAYFWRTWRTGARAPTSVRGSLLLFGKHCVDAQPDADFRARLQRAAALAAAGAPDRVFLLGGGDPPTEAEVAARSLRSGGWPEAVPLILEDESRDTLENLRHARRLLGDGATPVALLSNRYHLARCALLARCVGIEATPCAAEDRATLRGAWFTEAALLMWIDLGRRWAGLIRHRRMLQKLATAPER